MEIFYSCTLSRSLLFLRSNRTYSKFGKLYCVEGRKKPPSLISSKKPNPVLFLRSKKLILSCYKVQVFSRDYRKSPLDSIITTIATSNRCELDSLENLFSRESLRLDLIDEPALTEKQSNLFLSLANFTVSRDEKSPHLNKHFKAEAFSY